MASTAEEPEISPYELLNLSLEATDQEIKTAYRQRSLKVHPDRNPNNPDAARKFHELNQAYELLLDPLRRLALDAKVRLTQARKERFKAYDNKRKNLVEELEERERAHKRARSQKQKEEREVWTETERIKEEGRRLREEREKAAWEQEKGRAQQEGQDEGQEDVSMDGVDEPPALDQFDTTVRLKYSLKSRPELTTKESIAEYLSPFGPVDVDSIVFSMRTKTSKSKSKLKPAVDDGTATPTHATALVPFKNIGDAYASVTASRTSTSSRVNLKGMEITWVNNKEPLILGWLKKMGKAPNRNVWNLYPCASTDESKQCRKTLPLQAQGPTSTPISGPLGAPPGPTPFSSFPAPSATPKPPQAPSFSFPGVPSGGGSAPGLDYESITLLRLRQAERERLEKEIREAGS
ncbi:DnaJ domain-containing protein [Ephemerocybe angulata]|uniref:DnaJ domain-containing protein n=1 Tax=Ephemerocybe angulata TaxID=980116 RepID=A0A8H6IG19_9AGAR|nr:DnaJ domain-containing protein [Tulosesus angulatus]